MGLASLLRSCSLILAIAVLAPSSAHAQRCSKGKPCGNTCIARNKTCHVGEGTAVWAPGADRPASTAPESLRDLPPSPEALSAGPVTMAYCWVERVVDGDTFRCAGGRRVRLLLIDAPERNQGPFGSVATTALRRLAPVRSEVVLEFDLVRHDRYGRSLAYAYTADGRMVNEEMARGGYAVVSVYPPNVKHVDRIRAAVAEAQRARRGLWSTSAFSCSPADYRRGRCQ
jgi:micrococcal nuclease